VAMAVASTAEVGDWAELAVVVMGSDCGPVGWPTVAEGIPHL